MSNYRVAVDVGGTFTDVFVLDEDTARRQRRQGAVDAARSDGGDHERRRRGRASTCANVDAVLPRHDRRHQRADHAALPAGGDGDDARLPRRARDPPRHQGRPLGRLQGRRPGDHPAPRPPRGDRADRLRGPRPARRSTRTRRARSPDDLRARNVETVAVCFINAYANPANEQRMREILEEELPGRRRLDVERDPARDLRVRALLDHRRERGALAAGRRLRQAARRSG